MLVRLHTGRARSVVAARPVQAAARSTSSRGSRRSPYRNGHEVSLPVTLPMDKLPDDGEILTEAEMVCDPEERNCQTPMFVYEERCPICSGTGVTASPGRQRRLGSCALCGGIGYLRHVTSRYEPSVNGTLSGPTSLFRPKHVPEDKPEPKKYGEWN